MNAEWSPGTRHGGPVDVVGRRGAHHADNRWEAELMIAMWEALAVPFTFTVRSCACRPR